MKKSENGENENASRNKSHCEGATQRRALALAIFWKAIYEMITAKD